MKDLTGRQMLCLDFIIDHINLYGYPPTLREIGSEMDISSTNGVTDHLRALERKGYTRRSLEAESRGIRVLAFSDGIPCEVAVRVRREVDSSRDESRARDKPATDVQQNS